MLLDKITYEIEILIAKIQWRKNNKHNFTKISRIIPNKSVSVGNRSYGVLNVYSYGSSNEKLCIGNYVSIGPNVTFLLGGDHNLKTISTYPFKVKLLGEKCEATSKGQITLEDDVWIGINSTILSGVTIGKGAIVGAGSLVNKNVPPYAIVAGNPAKLVKYRFSPDIIDKLKNFNYANLSTDEIQDNIDFFYDELTTESFHHKFLNKFILDGSKK